METRRRQFLLAAGTLLAARVAHAQQPQKMRRFGILRVPPLTPRRMEIWRESLRRAGFEEGRNILIEWRSAEGEIKRLPELARELVRLKVELIVTDTNDATDAARQATQTIPIVMYANGIPVERGVIKSLARPGGNITGTVWLTDPQESFLKVWQITRDALPKASRVSFLTNYASPSMRLYDHSLVDQRAKEIGLSVQRIPISRRDELKPALDLVSLSRPDALVVAGNLNDIDALREIAAFAIEQKLVSISDSGAYANNGGLLAYGPDFVALLDLTFGYVSRLMHGAKPADLPVQGPTKWDTVLNAKTARAIGFKPPPAFMLQVTRQVE